MSFIEFKNLSFGYTKEDILRDISFKVERGEIAVFLGKSGTGKSTLLKLLSGLEHPRTGEISKDGNTISTPHYHLPANKRRTSVVFQDNTLFPHLTVKENITLSRKEVETNLLGEITSTLEIVDLMDKYPHQLSGGQSQRVTIARAIYQDSDLILFDEPFSALDTNLRIKLRRKIKSWLKETNKTAIFITHDKEEAFYLADQIFILNDGLIVQEGNQAELTSRPNSNFVAKFISRGICLSSKETSGLFVPETELSNFVFIEEKNIEFSVEKKELSLKFNICDEIEKTDDKKHIFIHLTDEPENILGPFEVSSEIKNNEVFLSLRDRTNFISLDK